MGPTAVPIKKAHEPKFTVGQEKPVNQRAWSPKQRDAQLPDTPLPFFLDIGAASSSRATAGPTVWTPSPYNRAMAQDLQAIHIHE
jgi:hypothetical protein